MNITTADILSLCGSVTDGSCTSVRIAQDDATCWWCVTVGTTSFYGPSFDTAIETALIALGIRSIQP